MDGGFWEEFSLRIKKAGGEMKQIKWDSPTDKDGLMTKEQIRAIQNEKGSCALPSAFIRQFDAEWTKTVNRLKQAKTK